MKTKIAGALQNLVLLTVAVLLALGAAEIGVRQLLPQYDPAGRFRFVRLPDGTPVGAPEAEGRHRNRNGEFDILLRHNTYGFRDSKDLRSARPEDLFIVGDSYTWGHGVQEEERFSNQLETLLGRRIYNIGIPTDLDGYALLLRRAERVVGPIRNLIVAVCMENDLHLYDERPANGATPQKQEAPSWKQSIAQNSAAYSLVTEMVHHQPFLRDLAFRVGLKDADLYDGPEINYDRERVVQSARRLASLVNGRNATIVLIPSRFMYFGDSKQREVARRLHEDFLKELKSLPAARVVDLDPVERTNPSAYHFPGDGHWNAEGHRIFAREIARALHRGE